MDCTWDSNMPEGNKNLPAWLGNIDNGHQEYRNYEPRACAAWTPLQRARINAALMMADAQIKERKDRVRKQFNRNYKALVRKVKSEEARQKQRRHLQGVASEALKIVAQIDDQKPSQKKFVLSKRSFAEGYRAASRKASIYRFVNISKLPKKEEVCQPVKSEETGNSIQAPRTTTKLRITIRKAVRSHQTPPAVLPHRPDSDSYPVRFIKEESI